MRLYRLDDVTWINLDQIEEVTSLTASRTQIRMYSGRYYNTAGKASQLTEEMNAAAAAGVPRTGTGTG